MSSEYSPPFLVLKKGNIALDTDFGIMLNSSDWFGMNSYPKLSPEQRNSFFEATFDYETMKYFVITTKQFAFYYSCSNLYVN